MAHQTEAQPTSRAIAVASGRVEPTPVVGITQPTGVIAGPLRRLSYGMPEHRARHWMMLLAADRIDVLEHRVRGAAHGDRSDLRRLAMTLAQGALIGAAVLVAARRRPRA